MYTWLLVNYWLITVLGPHCILKARMIQEWVFHTGTVTGVGVDKPGDPQVGCKERFMVFVHHSSHMVF